MSIKRTFITYGILIVAGIAISSFAIGNNIVGKASAKPTPSSADNRISLALSPQLKTRQLSKMRSHFKSLQNIVRLIAEEQFIEAAAIADSNLTGNGGKQKLLAAIDNNGFKQMGLAFHESASELSRALKSKDTKKSLQVLSTTMNHCTQCHEVFRQ